MSAMDGRVCLLFLCAFAPTLAQRNQVNVNDYLFSGGLEYNDLSHPFNADTTYWPGSRKFEVTSTFASTRPDGVWYSSREFCAAEHGGTHLDAPRHFGQHKRTVDQIPFGHLITPLRIVDLSKIVAGNNDFVLQKHHMDFLFAGDDRRNFTVIFRFGWSQFYGDKQKYLGVKTPTKINMNFPGISEDVAKWIAENKNLVGVGVDTPSVDPGSEQLHHAHRVLAERNIFILENINMPEELPASLCSIVVMPMNIEEGTGAPCRVTAICPRLHGRDLF